MAKKLNAEQIKQLRNKKTGNWRDSIVKALTSGPKTAIEVYNETRTDRLDISDAKKQHNVASQLTYLADDGYVWVKEDKSIYLLADPEGNVIEANEKVVDRLLK